MEARAVTGIGNVITPSGLEMAATLAAVLVSDLGDQYDHLDDDQELGENHCSVALLGSD